MASSPAELRLPKVRSHLLARVDIASLVFFRIGFGIFLAWWAWDYLTSGRVTYYYVQPRFHFTWWGFDWVRPWPGVGMYVHFLALAALGSMVAAGCFYRAACVLLALGFGYVFLLDATNYQNHYYLLLLLCGVLTFVPAHCAVSVDAARRPEMRSDTIPAWALWLVRFHIALPYVFGGLAKLDSDWLSGLPMRQMISPHASWPMVGWWLASREASLLLAWGGLVFDVLIVPLLLWKRTCAVAFAVCVLFHLLNSVLFSIHVFPWFMIFASTIFFAPEWPRRMLGGRPHFESQPGANLLPVSRESAIHSQRTGTMFGPGYLVALLVIYCAFHLLWPLRHHVCQGNVNWTERGHYFSWRMMLRNKVAGVRYFVTDALEEATWHPNLRPYINPEQAGKFTKDPDMIVQMARFIAAEERQRTGHPIEVRALALVSLNGRKPQLFIDPEIDLAREPPHALVRSWLVPLKERLPDEPWDKPLNEWEQYIELPPLPKVSARK